MHRDLETWLEEVWRDRETIFRDLDKTGRAILQHPIDNHPGIQRVYDKYARGSSDTSGEASDNTPEIVPFLQDMANFIEERQARCYVQWDNRFFPFESSQLRDVAQGRVMLFEDPNYDRQGLSIDEAPTRKLYRFPRTHVGRSFIHVMNPNTHRVDADQRIYLNLRAQDRAEHFCNIVDGVYGDPAFHSAKVVGPVASPRNDSALIYLRGQDAVERALSNIRQYQTYNPGAFLPGLPRLTAKIDDLNGVGRGMEPPHYAIIRQGDQYYKRTSSMSFGLYRSALIFMALDRTYWSRPGQDEARRLFGLKRRAAKYFRAAGIDPDNPSVQVNPDHLPDLGH